MNFQNVRLRSLLCAVLSVILVTGSMILPAFAAEQNVNFSYVESVPSATVAPAGRFFTTRKKFTSSPSMSL